MTQGGRTGSTKARLHDVFVKRLRHLKDKETYRQKEAFCHAEQRPWQFPEDFENDVLDIETLHEPSFDRTDANTNYEECMQDAASAGTTGDVISLKQQIDYNATEERAFRTRHASVVRSQTHGMCRRHGMAVSRVFVNIEKQAASIISKGAQSG